MNVKQMEAMAPTPSATQNMKPSEVVNVKSVPKGKGRLWVMGGGEGGDGGEGGLRAGGVDGR